MSPLRVVLADDHPVVRAGLAALLSSLDDIEVVGTAADGQEAVDLVTAERPDVVVLDLHMPGLDGLAAAREVRRTSPDTGVLVLSMHTDDASLVAALRAGARGYLVKGAEQDEIERAVRAVARGEAIFGRGVAELAVGLLAEGRRTRDTPFPQLSEREERVLDLLASGLDNGAIATRLGISPKTVANNVSTVLTKLGVPDRARAVLLARDAGLGARSTTPTG